jgi:hypothetical protein
MAQCHLDGSATCHHFAVDPIVHLHSRPVMHAMRLPVLLLTPLFVAACANPRAEANVATALNDAANEIGGLKNDLGQLQLELDSLRTIVAKQDTTITHLAAVANVPITR